MKAGSVPRTGWMQHDPNPDPDPDSEPEPDFRAIQHPHRRRGEVRLRGGDRCQWPLGSGGVCGSTWQVELDHVVQQALDGPTDVSNLRWACRVHHRRAAVLELGEGPVGGARKRRRR